MASKYIPPRINIFYYLGRHYTCFLVRVATSFALTYLYHCPTVAQTFSLFNAYD